MVITDALTALYLTCFIACSLPAMIRIMRRQSSADLSVWREWLLLVGVSAQFVVMTLTGADWRVKASPILSGLTVCALLVVIRHYKIHKRR